MNGINKPKRELDNYEAFSHAAAVIDTLILDGDFQWEFFELNPDEIAFIETSNVDPKENDNFSFRVMFDISVGFNEIKRKNSNFNVQMSIYYPNADIRSPIKYKIENVTRINK